MKHPSQPQDCSCRDLSVDEAIELGRRSIYHATFRDAVSGGTVSGEALVCHQAALGMIQTQLHLLLSLLGSTTRDCLLHQTPLLPALQCTM